MADVKTVDEVVEFPEKRKLDVPSSIDKAPEEDNDKADSNKKQKIENNGSDQHPPDSKETHQNVDVSAAENEDEDENEYEGEDEDEEEDYNAEQDEDGDDEEAVVVDRKGKGIMRDDKGKGKMVEESEDDDDDDSDGNSDSSDDSDSDFSDGLNDDSDIEDDPLAEVDLDNILPSRTRQRRAQPGVRISSDPTKAVTNLNPARSSSHCCQCCPCCCIWRF